MVDHSDRRLRPTQERGGLAGGSTELAARPRGSDALPREADEPGRTRRVVAAHDRVPRIRRSVPDAEPAVTAIAAGTGVGRVAHRPGDLLVSDLVVLSASGKGEGGDQSHHDDAGEHSPELHFCPPRHLPSGEDSDPRNGEISSPTKTNQKNF